MRKDVEHFVMLEVARGLAVVSLTARLGEMS
jgi:hypothetical protein